MSGDRSLSVCSRLHSKFFDQTFSIFGLGDKRTIFLLIYLETKEVCQFSYKALLFREYPRKISSSLFPSNLLRCSLLFNTACTPKLIKILQVRFLTLPYFIWSHCGSRAKIHHVLCVASCIQGFYLEFYKNAFSFQHNSSHYLERSVLPFHHAILLTCFGCPELMGYPISITGL